MSQDPFDAPVIHGATLSESDSAPSLLSGSNDDHRSPISPQPSDREGLWLAENPVELNPVELTDEPELKDRSLAFIAAGFGLILATVCLVLLTGMGDENGSTSALTSTQNGDGGSDLRSAAAALAPLGSSATTSSPVDPLSATALDRTTSSTTTSTVATTTSMVLIDPPIGPPSQWVDTGNGVLVPDVLLRIRFCESTNDYRSENKKSSARGAYQFLRGSWDWYGHAATTGVTEAHLATPAQQDAAALLTLQRDGTRPWLASRKCWADPNINPSYRSASPPSTTTVEAPTTTVEAPTTTSVDTTADSTTTTTTEPTSNSTTTTTTESSTSVTPTTSTTSVSTTSTLAPTSSSAAVETTDSPQSTTAVDSDETSPE